MADEADSRGATPTIEELQRKVIELQDRLRDVQHEAKDHRLARNAARRQIEELERAQARSADAPAELEALRRENRQLKHRTVFERVAREAGARTSGKALDALWQAVGYDAQGDADSADLKARIEGARPDYDFLFEVAPAPAPTPGGEMPPAKDDRPNPGDVLGRRETPAARPGPGGSGRGAPADGAGTVKLRKSDLQSFDPRVNPLMDGPRAQEVVKARREGKLQYVDE
jgi:hypothetical protein